MAKIKFKIVTPEKIIFEKEINSVTLPTTTGEITVLPNHVPLLTQLTAGELTIKTEQEIIHLAVSRGFVEVKPGSVVTVLTETAERAEEINEAKAQAAKEQAQNLLKNLKNKEAVDYTGLVAKMEKELARLKVARRHQRHQSVKPNIVNE
jgi:F-type H+-transporting ATPase subunit epsilon